MGLIERFKRNQVEDAVLATLYGDRDGDGPDPRVRIKRLLDADRLLGSESGPADGKRGHYAFYSNKGPGTGMEVWFSPYEAFALLLALRLLDHGWPQGTVVRIMRQLRPELEPAHTRILRQNPGELFAEEGLRRQARPGVLFTGNTDPIFLAISAVKRAADQADRERAPYTFAVHRGQEELMKFILKEVPIGSVTTSLELAGSAHLLARHLSNTQPRRRGRSG